MLKKMGVVLTSVILSACVSPQVNTSIVGLQKTTAEILGLGSSDELTVSDVQTEPENLGMQPLSYRATTKNGRIFDCKATLQSGIVLVSKPQVTNPSCVPVVAHSQKATTKKKKGM